MHYSKKDGGDNITKLMVTPVEILCVRQATGQK